ncbi:hypothetical protein [Empedobacter tilapiae]|uniref:hypothetical protein n=1 Tax=Empedobacter tilapiae TaxID=2491114 RepID=UPI0028D8E7C3|nr:hypothetical protein [Empedobacter tilapiae]
MAKSDNLFNIRGKVGDLIFFQRNGQTFVKKNTGGFVNGKSHEHPRTKAAQQRFKEVAIFVGRFKKALNPMIWRQKDGTFHNQLMSFFSKIRKESTQENFYLTLIDAHEKGKLQHKKLNKNSKLNPFDCTYSLHENTLFIENNLSHFCAQKHPTACLEICFGWMYYNKELELELVYPQYFYYSLVENQNPRQKITCELINDNEKVTEFALPIISITVVNQPNSSAVALHPYHFTLTTIV